MSLSLALRFYAHRKGSALVERRERLQARLKAWWKGYHPHLSKVAVVEGEERTTTAASEVAPSIPVELVEESIEGAKPNPWSRERLLLLAELWGSGFTSPGGQEFGMELVKPLAPNSKMSLFNLNATLGGTARTIANAYQMWVNAFEPNETPARIGMEMSTRGGLAKRAPIEFCDHEHLRERLKQDGRQYDSIFAKEGFFKVEHKKELFSAIYDHLKSDGQLLFTDYVLAEAGEISQEVEARMNVEPHRPHLWTVEQTITCLKSLELDLRISEDMTARYRQMALRGWSDHVERLKKQGASTPAMLDALLLEVEIWARRILAFDRGGLRVYRVHAIKQTELGF